MRRKRGQTPTRVGPSRVDRRRRRNDRSDPGSAQRVRQGSAGDHADVDRRRPARTEGRGLRPRSSAAPISASTREKQVPGFPSTEYPTLIFLRRKVAVYFPDGWGSTGEDRHHLERGLQDGGRRRPCSTIEGMKTAYGDRVKADHWGTIRRNGTTMHFMYDVGQNLLFACRASSRPLASPSREIHPTQWGCSTAAVPTRTSKAERRTSRASSPATRAPLRLVIGPPRSTKKASPALLGARPPGRRPRWTSTTGDPLSRRAHAERRRFLRRQRGEMPATTTCAGSTAPDERLVRLPQRAAAWSRHRPRVEPPATRLQAGGSRLVCPTASTSVPTSRSDTSSAAASDAPSSSAAQSCSPPPKGTKTPPLVPARRTGRRRSRHRRASAPGSR